MDDFTQVGALRALIDRARSRLSPGDLPGLVMGDPGSGGYVAAYERVLRGGVPALVAGDDHGRLLSSFDITENLLLSHAEAGRSVTHRWFSVLTAGIELLGWDGDAPLAMVLGKPNHAEGLDVPAIEDVRCFVLAPGHGILIHAGTWHDFPLAIDRPVTVLTANSEGVVAALASQEVADEMSRDDVHKIDVLRRTGTILNVTLTPSSPR